MHTPLHNDKYLFNIIVCFQMRAKLPAKQDVMNKKQLYFPQVHHTK